MISDDSPFIKYVLVLTIPFRSYPGFIRIGVRHSTPLVLRLFPKCRLSLDRFIQKSTQRGVKRYFGGYAVNR